MASIALSTTRKVAVPSGLSMLRLFGLAVSSCVILVSLTGSVAAQAHEPPPEAMVLFEEAREQYRQGEYGAAAENLERALVLDPSAPTLLFNLARVYELLGDYEHSISVYRRLLAVTPAEQTEDRERTQATIDRLEGAREHQAPPPTVEEAEREAPRGPTFVRERGVADGAFWGVLGTGAAITLAAVACGIASLLYFDQGSTYTLMYPGDDLGRASYFTDSQTTGLTADILGGVGAATLATAFLLFILREHTYESWDARVGAGSIGLAVRFGDGG